MAAAALERVRHQLNLSWGILPFMLLILLGNLLIAWRGGAPAGENLLAPARVRVGKRS